MRSVLIADDNRFMVQTLCDVLSLHGWTAHGVSSGEEALRAAAERTYRCVIMDIKMDGQDGFSVMQRIKRREASTPVFLMTAYTAEELVAEARRNGTLQTIVNMTSVDSIVTEIAAASSKGGSAMLLSRQQGFVDNVGAALEKRGIPFARIGDTPDLLAEFERQPPTVTLVAGPHTGPSEANGYLITGLDAGVWVILSNQLEPSACVVANTVTSADGFFRKPLAIPALVERLNAVTSR